MLKKSTSLFSMKGKKKEANESAENLIPAVPAMPASTSSAQAGPSGGSSFLRKARSFVGKDKTPSAAPPVPTDQLPKNLRVYADMVPGAGSRDMATKTPPPSPTAGTHDGRAVAIKERHQKRPLQDRLTSRLAKVEQKRKDTELADAFAMNKAREPEQRVAKVPPKYTHTPMAQGTWKEPGVNPNPQSVKLQTQRFPENKAAAAVVGPEKPNLQGIVKDARGRVDKNGREAMPAGNKGRQKYEKIASGKGKDGPSV